MEKYITFSDLPDLGTATTGTSVTGVSFMIVPRGRGVRERYVAGVGKRLYRLVDQLANDGSIILTPGGVWGENTLIVGQLATVHDDAVSRSLMARFSKPIRQHFEKIRAFWVGAEARRIFDDGLRLTFSAEAPPEYDLTRP